MRHAYALHRSKLGQLVKTVVSEVAGEADIRRAHPPKIAVGWDGPLLPSYYPTPN